nr:immunoglobulin light chain junction region [Macaca mulatta]MOW39362.1 immunoglobulin light chain junction region [Macaca mulatta]MOW39470.1 immunoglobulin light chain junction region [Macaca mulatta]MOW39489.1 immunoglobulin light chain junction region [Macaca mulatta]MOW39577.1 immunoglobulin light chain junction region [Macaca mulatta]
CQQHNSHPPTF